MLRFALRNLGIDNLPNFTCGDIKHRDGFYSVVISSSECNGIVILSVSESNLDPDSVEVKGDMDSNYVESIDCYNVREAFVKCISLSNR